MNAGFYTVFDGRLEENVRSSFEFLKDLPVASESSAYNFLHGVCDEFAAMLSEMYGYQIECVRNGDGRLIHAYCVTEIDGQKAYVDVRGVTTDPELFFHDFRNELRYYAPDGSILVVDSDGQEVVAEIETWENKDVFFDGEYEGWTDDAIKAFIREQGDCYNPNHIVEGFFAQRMLFHVTLMENVGSIRAQGLIPQIGARAAEFGENEKQVYLFRSYEDADNALANWLGDWYEDEYREDVKLAVLKVMVPPEITVYDEGRLEIVCKDIIPPECIEFYDEMGNELLGQLEVPAMKPVEFTVVENGIYPAAMTKQGILDAVMADEDLTVESTDDKGLVVWDDDGSKMIPFHFLEEMGPEGLSELIDISGDIPACYRPDKDVLAKYLWGSCDRNAFITLEKLAIIWSEPDDPEAFEPSDFVDELAERLYEEYSDEYAFLISDGLLGQLWFERNIPVVNMGEVVRAAREVAEENRDSFSSFFNEERLLQTSFLTTAIHELRHLQMDTNHFLPEAEYPDELAEEEAVEKYCWAAYDNSVVPSDLFPAFQAKVGGLDMYFRRTEDFTVEKINGKFHLEMYGEGGTCVKGAIPLFVQDYDTLYDALTGVVQDSVWDSTEVIGNLLVGDDTEGVSYADKLEIIEQYGDFGRFSIDEDGVVSENIEIRVQNVRFDSDLTENDYVVGSVFVDGIGCSFDYRVDDGTFDIHCYGESGWMTGASYEKPLPGVVCRNWEAVSEACFEAIDGFLEKESSQEHGEAALLDEALERAEEISVVSGHGVCQGIEEKSK